MDKSRKFAALIVITIILTGFFNKGLAQEDDGEPHGYYVEQPRTFYGGLTAGANFSQVDGDYFAGYNKVGVNVGGIVYAQLEKHIAASLEILYSQKGSKSTGPREVDNGSYITDYGINLNYAEIPVMINYFDKRKSHFGAGLSYSRLTSSSEDLFTSPANNVDLSKYPFKSSDLNAVAGFELHLVKGLFLNVRFQYSLTPVRSNVLPDYSRSSQYNNLFVFRLMYLFI
jgi:hypothetical protein